MVDIILSGTFILDQKGRVLLLHRTDHDHYETPGGKIEQGDALDLQNPTIDELLTRAKTELEEEVGGIVVKDFEYFGWHHFTIPGGRSGRANKFIARYISGDPYPKESKFDGVEFLPIHELEAYRISPDLKLFLPKLKEYVRKN